MTSVIDNPHIPVTSSATGEDTIVVHAAFPGDSNVVFHLVGDELDEKLSPSGRRPTEAFHVSTTGATKLAEALLSRAGYLDGKLVLHEQSELIIRALQCYQRELHRIITVEGQTLPPAAVGEAVLARGLAMDLRDQLSRNRVGK